jgi:hypothetical protein
MTTRELRTRATYDADLVLKTAGLIAASAAVATIVDLGDGDIMGDVIVDVSACEVATGDESYMVVAQFSDKSDFADTIINGAVLPLGDAAGLATIFNSVGDVDMVEGRYKLPFTNKFDSVSYRYMRLYTVVAGTIATGINYTAYIAKR